MNYDKFHIENVCCIPTTFNGGVLFELPSSLVPSIILGKCKEWTENMMAIHGVRLRRLTSRTISTLLFGELIAWAICNVEMMAMIFVTNVEMK